MNRTAFDTGFLVKYLAGDPLAIWIFSKMASGMERPVLPSPVYFELKFLALGGTLLKEKWSQFREGIKGLIELHPLEEKTLHRASLANRLKHARIGLKVKSMKEHVEAPLLRCFQKEPEAVIQRFQRRKATRLDSDQLNLDLNWRYLISSMAISAVQIWM